MPQIISIKDLKNTSEISDTFRNIRTTDRKRPDKGCKASIRGAEDKVWAIKYKLQNK